MAASTRPELHVKVMNFDRKTITLWTFAHFTQRLVQMRSLSALADKPCVLCFLARASILSFTDGTGYGFCTRAFAKHFSSTNTFSDAEAPSFSHVGNCTICLTPIIRHISFSATSPIFSLYTAYVSEQSLNLLEVKLIPSFFLQGGYW